MQPTPTIAVTPEQLVQELEERLIQQMTLHHIELQNKDLEIKKLREELIGIYLSMRLLSGDPEFGRYSEIRIKELKGKIII